MCSFFAVGEQLKVHTESGRVQIAISSPKKIPKAVQAMCEQAPGILRVAGSAMDLSRDNQTQLMNFVQLMFMDGGCLQPATIIMSSGWRMRDEHDHVVRGVLEVPYEIQRLNSQCRRLGTVPLTSDTMCFYGDNSTFAPIDTPARSVQANPDNELLWVVCDDEPLSFHGDVRSYFYAMDRMKAQNKATGLLVFGGGPVTAVEIFTALVLDHPIGFVRGFAGLAGDIMHTLDGHHDLVDPHSARILSQWQEMRIQLEGIDVISTPSEGRNWLRRHGF